MSQKARESWCQHLPQPNMLFPDLGPLIPSPESKPQFREKQRPTVWNCMIWKTERWWNHCEIRFLIFTASHATRGPVNQRNCLLTAIAKCWKGYFGVTYLQTARVFFRLRCAVRQSYLGHWTKCGSVWTWQRTETTSQALWTIVQIWTPTHDYPPAPYAIGVQSGAHPKMPDLHLEESEKTHAMFPSWFASFFLDLFSPDFKARVNHCLFSSFLPGEFQFSADVPGVTWYLLWKKLGKNFNANVEVQAGHALSKTGQKIFGSTEFRIRRAEKKNGDCDELPTLI